MDEPPAGTVTFLFTDIEGSTKRWEQYPQAMNAALARHDEMIRTAIEVNGGYVFKTMGDAFCAAFAAPNDALLATLDAQRALGAEQWDDSMGAIRVRMALHTGVAQERDGDYFGQPVNRVARLLSAGHGGQVLLSEATFGLVRDALPLQTELRELGEHHLKDLFRPERIFQLLAPDLPSDFPPLRTLDTGRNNLPIQPTPLIGREKELAAVEKMLLREDVRLLTLTGPGGTGKTRVGLQVAADLIDQCEDGVFFVNLAPLADHNLVISTVAQTLDVKESGGRPLLDSLKDYLRDKQMLLVLDNFEQVVEAAPVVSELLASAVKLKVLVTSRAKLQVSGEHEYQVPPMELPDTKQLPSMERLTQYEAVRLFIERAEAAKSDFEVTNNNAPAVAQICVRLDGLPLAIELAAARIKILPPQAMLARLQSRLKVLTGGGRDLPARQQTLRNTIEWSYELLEEEEKKQFRRMAVFVGGCTLEAIEAVCSADGDLGIDVLDGVQSLVDKSLVRQIEGVGGESRFVMLETIHEYARERLEESREREMLQRCHAEYYMVLAEEARPQMIGALEVEWLDRLEAEYDNIRAALKWAVKSDAEVGLRLAGALDQFWYRRGNNIREAKELLEALLSQPHAAKRGVYRAKALDALGGMNVDITSMRSHYEESLAIYKELGDKRSIAYALNMLSLVTFHDEASARSMCEEALELFRELGDKQGIARSFFRLGQVAQFGKDEGNETARVCYEESITLYREIGDRAGMAMPLLTLANIVAYIDGDYTSARLMYEESLAIYRDIRDATRTAMLLVSLGYLAINQGEYLRARSLLEECLAIGRELRDKLPIMWAFSGLGELARSEGDYSDASTLFEEAMRNSQELRELGSADIDIGWRLRSMGSVAQHRGDLLKAKALFVESLALFKDAGNKYEIAICLQTLAGVSGAQGQAEKAARLFGAAEVLFHGSTSYFDHRFPVDHADDERNIAAARAQLDEATWQAAWDEGRAMTMEQAIDLALALELPESTANKGRRRFLKYT